MCSLLATKGIILASVVGVISLGLRGTGWYSPSYPVVQTLSGPVRGVISISRDGREFAEFLGIPYATANRFEAPEPAKSWDKILDANSYGPDCYQYDAMVKGRFMGDENCLSLNVYTPDINGSKTVLIWIHGGGFLSGGSGMYSPTYFMDEDVVMVSMNYRLGPFGFLNTGDEQVRGNMGLKDQNMALRWVQQNIKNFGGNPNKVTILGESAGAASVHYHIVSPASKSLFAKAIMQSGAITCPWSFVPDSRSQALNFGMQVNCPVDNTTALVSCLKKLSSKELVLPMVDFMRNGPVAAPGSMMVPTLETVVNADAFLSENPRVLIQKGKFNRVPLLLGITSGEGGLRTSRLEANEKVLDSVDEKWNDICPLMQYFDPKKTKVSQKIREAYFGKGTFSDNPSGFLKNFTQMLTDGIFSHPVHNAAVSHANQGSPVYMYYYNYNSVLPSTYSAMKAVDPDSWIPSELSVAYSIAVDLFKKYFGYPGPHEYGPCHADDLFQLWEMQWPFQIGQSSSDYDFSKKFVKAMADFAKDEKTLKFNGIPWPSIDPKSHEPLKYMELDETGRVIDEPFVSKLAFWDSLNIRDPAESHNW